jgi:hypothetical protein
MVGAGEGVNTGMGEMVAVAGYVGSGLMTWWRWRGETRMESETLAEVWSGDGGVGDVRVGREDRDAIYAGGRGTGEAGEQVGKSTAPHVSQH